MSMYYFNKKNTNLRNMECLSIRLNDQNICSLIIIATVLINKYI